MDQNEERELLKQVANGNDIAFRTLFDAHYQSLATFIYGITKSRELSEEITMDVFLKIWMARETLLEVRNFKAYLFTISRNTAISELRKLFSNRTNETKWKSNLDREFEDYEPEKEMQLSLIDEAINQLSPHRRKIYLLSRQKGLKYEEIALQLGISRFTVRANIQQAVDFIVRYVKQRGGNSMIIIWAILIFF